MMYRFQKIDVNSDGTVDWEEFTNVRSMPEIYSKKEEILRYV